MTIRSGRTSVESSGAQMCPEPARDADCVRVVERVALDRHRCLLPGWWQRRRLNIDYGSVVECPCGRQWKWSYNWADAYWQSVDGSA